MSHGGHRDRGIRIKYERSGIGSTIQYRSPHCKCGQMHSIQIKPALAS